MEPSISNAIANPASGESSRGGSGSGSATPLQLQAPQPVPIPITGANAPPPPFLVKTYDMVDDPSTDKIVSWSSTNNSFVVWDQPEFTRNLLPKYFKHNNFASFVRQLNTYGFRKVDPDRQEFANEGFLRGQKHLLKTISRRKVANGNVQQSQSPQQQPPCGENKSASPCIETGNFGLPEEVERLKRDKNVLMQELIRLRHQQQTTDNQLQKMTQHLQGMEQRQQQMMSFLAKAVNSPAFLSQFVQQQNDSSRRIVERSKKRRLKQDDGLADQTFAATDGQIVKYQPMINEAAKAMLRQLVKLDPSPILDNNYVNTSENFLISNGSAAKPIDREITNHLPAVSLQNIAPTTVQDIPPLQNIPPTSVHSPLPLPSPSPSPFSFQNSSTYSSDIQPPLFGGATKEISDVMPHSVSHPPSMSPEGDDIDILGVDTSSSDITGISPLDSDDIVSQIAWGDNSPLDVEDDNNLPCSSDPFWEPLFNFSSHGFETEEMAPSMLEDLSKAVDFKPQVNGWDEGQLMDHLTMQMSYLA